MVRNVLPYKPATQWRVGFKKYWEGIKNGIKVAVGKIVKIQDFANKFEHRQLLSPSPLSAAAQTVS